MWNRRDVESLQSRDLPWQIVPSGHFGSAGSGVARTLSVDPTDGAITQIVRIHDAQFGTLAAKVDMFVLSGAARVNGQLVRPGTYIFAPEESRFDVEPLASRSGFVAYYGFWSTPFHGPSDGTESKELMVKNSLTMQWDMPEWSGETELEPGVGVKWFRRDDDGVVYMSGMLPGWKCLLEESHPVYEESFKLTGTILMGGRGVTTPGSYFYRGPDVFHGPLYSADGTTSFIRSDAPTTTTYREPSSDLAWGHIEPLGYGNTFLDATFRD